MHARILVTGGTGTIGSIVVELLRSAEVPVRVLSRHDSAAQSDVENVVCDLATGDGLDEALLGIDTVIHLAGGPKGDAAATQNLVNAAQRSGIRHIVLISVVGADTMPIGYFREKLGAERAVERSGIPWTTLRAAQANSLVLKMLQALAKLPVVPNPTGLRAQPVDERDIAARLVELALADPAGRVPDLTGPETFDMGELARSYLTARGRRRPLLRLRIPGAVGKAYRAGNNLVQTGASVGPRRWADYLTEKLDAASAHARDRASR